MRIEVVYALAGHQDRVSLELPAGASAGDAVRASGLLARHALRTMPALGIGGRRVAPEQPVADGDRIEILRPLPVDPVEARHRRARVRRR